MNALKSHAFLRPSSRPSSPAPPSPAPIDRVSRPLNRLSLTNFRRPSPAPQPNPAQVPLVQDASYLEMLGLKLSEAVSKALAPPPGPAVPNESVSGRKPIPAGRGRSLGNLITAEIKAAHDNPNLIRAILRSLQRPLSVLLTNLSTQIAPLLASPAFGTLPTVQSPTLNATQLHVIAITNFASELLESFDEFNLGVESDARGDGLKPIRDGLVSLVTRGVNPLIAAIRGELTTLIEALEFPPPNSTSNKPSLGTKGNGAHPSITTLQGIVPIYSKLLSRFPSTTVAQKQLTTLLISIVWKGLVALSHRPNRGEFTPPASPMMNGSVRKRRGSPSTTTPPMTPPTGLFNIKLPPSRPPSPHAAVFTSSLAGDANALYGILQQLPRPKGEAETIILAMELVDEVFDALKAFAPFIELLHNVAPDGFGSSFSGHIDGSLQKQLEDATKDIPTLICLPCLLHGGETVAHMLGLPENDYRQACLSGFARAEECVDAVGRTVLDILQADPNASPVISNWLEMELAPSDDESDS